MIVCSAFGSRGIEKLRVVLRGLSCRQFRSTQRETFCGVVVGRHVLEGRWGPRIKREKMASAAESSRKVS